MTENTKKEKDLKIFGYWFSGIWFVCIIVFCFLTEKNPFELKLNEFGDFLAGGVAPLAFLWFVLAFFQQSKELKQNTEMLKLQSDELKLTREEMAKQSQELCRQSEYMAMQISREKASDMPRLIYKRRGTGSTAKGMVLTISFENIGGRALDLSISSSDPDMPKIDVCPKTSIDRKHEGKITIERNNIEVDSLLALQFSDIHNQRFEISGFLRNDNDSIKKWFENVIKLDG